MKKIARGAALFLVILIVFTLTIFTCYASYEDTRKNWEIENNLEDELIRVKANYEENTITIFNESRTNIEVEVEFSIRKHTEDVSYRLEGLSSETINLNDYFSESALQNEQLKIVVTGDISATLVLFCLIVFFVLLIGMMAFICE